MSQENNENNIVTFEDENGESVDLEIVEYFFYDGQEYVILADTSDLDDENDDPDNVPEVDVYVMRVEPVDDENEDFVPVDPELEPEVLEYAEKYLNGETEEDDEEE